jgi:hypothetical protein
MTHMQKNDYESVRLNARLTLHHTGFCILHQESISSWLPFLTRTTAFHYFKIPRFVDVVDNIRFLSIPTPKNWTYVINNHVVDPEQNSLYILNKYLSYVRIQDLPERRMNLDILVTCIVHRPDVVPKLWDSYTRWYHGFPPDITHPTVKLELFHSVDLAFFEPFCMGLQDTHILTSIHDRDHLIITAATKEKPELLNKLYFHKFPYLNLFLFNENGTYPIIVETTLLFI